MAADSLTNPKRILVKKPLFLSLCLFLAACQSNSGNSLKTVDDENAAKLIDTLESGKAVIVGDVYFNDTYCGGSSISMTNVATSSSARIVNGSLVSLGIWKDVRAVQPGTYRITGVSCGDSSVNIGGDWADVLTGTDKLKKALAPTFTAKPGEVLHIGTMRINVIKKSTFFSSAKVFVTREATSPEAKARAKTALAGIDRPIQFTD